MKNVRYTTVCSSWWSTHDVRNI